jgi:chromosome segregation ATPase
MGCEQSREPAVNPTTPQVNPSSLTAATPAVQSPVDLEANYKANLDSVNSFKKYFEEFSKEYTVLRSNLEANQEKTHRHQIYQLRSSLSKTTYETKVLECKADIQRASRTSAELRAQVLKIKAEVKGLETTGTVDETGCAVLPK